MLIVVDEEIAGAREAFGRLGEVRLVAGRKLAGGDVAQADALIVRSVTRVDAALLAGSRVRFVGTVTSGADHVDTDYLAASGIAFASAAGCNAVAVAEYVLAAILLLAERRGFDPSTKTLGVIGVGRIGSIVARWGQALGMRVLRCDPPLQRRQAGGEYVDLAALAAASDLVTLHVPLTRQGPDRTAGMVNAEWLSTLKAGAVLINTSRGEVVLEGDLLAAIRSGRVAAAVLDVWCNEPDISFDLVDAVDLATPHVAGYSVEARQRGVRMIRNSLAEFMGRQCVTPSSEAVAVTDITASPGGPYYRTATQAALAACPLAALDAELRRSVQAESSARAFDLIRRRASARREFSAFRILGASADQHARRLLLEVGFHCD